jgi:hypothetical protein
MNPGIGPGETTMRTTMARLFVIAGVLMMVFAFALAAHAMPRAHETARVVILADQTCIGCHADEHATWALEDIALTGLAVWSEPGPMASMAFCSDCHIEQRATHPPVPASLGPGPGICPAPPERHLVP